MGIQCQHVLADEENEVANLSIRKLNDETIARLRVRAASHQVSMEEEARRILGQAVATPKRLGDLSVQFFGPESGVDLELPQYPVHKPMSFS
jgi:plasmid stability protein